MFSGPWCWRILVTGAFILTVPLRGGTMLLFSPIYGGRTAHWWFHEALGAVQISPGHLWVIVFCWLDACRVSYFPEYNWFYDTRKCFGDGSHGPGTNYELQLTENNFEAALSWQSLEKPSYGLAHSLWASPGDERSFFPFPIMVRSTSHPGRTATSQCQPTSAEQMACGVRECFQTAGWQKRIHPDESENLYAQLILLESRTGMGIAHKVGMQGNLQLRLLSIKQFNQLGCSMKERHALKQGGERGLL